MAGPGIIRMAVTTRQRLRTIHAIRVHRWKARKLLVAMALAFIFQCLNSSCNPEKRLTQTAIFG